MDRRAALRRLSAISLGAAGIGVSGCGAPENGRPSLGAAPIPSTTTEQYAQILVTPSFDQADVAQTADPSSDPAADAAEQEVTAGADEEVAVSPHRSIVATAVGTSVDVFDTPGGSVTHTMGNPTPTNGPLVFLTKAFDVDGWHEVLLPVRPNGSVGWIPADSVGLTEHRYRIKVDLDEFRLRLFEEGEVIFETVAGVARDNAPTPGGEYYITELLAPTEANSPYGTFAYGLSGFSEVFETFAGGPGQLGIHGTNDPSTLGTAVSSGCIRLHNDDIAELVKILPLGVPVTVA